MADRRDDDLFPPPQDDFGARNPYVSPVAEELRDDEYVTRSAEQLNPWVSMWMRPRATVRQMLETDPTRYVLLLAVLGGVSGVFDDANFAYPDLATRLAVFVGYVLLGAVIGVVFLYLFAWLVGLTGRGIGGVASAAEARTALAWSNIPSVWLLPINVGLALTIAVLGPENVLGGLIGPAPEGGDEIDFAAIPPWLMVLGAIGVLVALWQIVITCQAIGEAHRFSSLRGFGTLILAGLALVGIAMLVGLPILGLYLLLGT